jgi:hypothetical protein
MKQGFDHKFLTPYRHFSQLLIGFHQEKEKFN